MSGRIVVRGVTAACLSLLLSGCWLQPGFDGGGTRWNWMEEELTAANVASLTEVWSVDLPWAPSEPLVYGGKVFVGRRGAPNGSSSVVRALDAATGETAWEQTLTPEGGDALPHLPATFIGGELWSDYWLASDDCPPTGGVLDPVGVGVTVRIDPDDGTIAGSDQSHLPVRRPIQSGDHVVQTYVQGDENGCARLNGTKTLAVRDSRTLETLWTVESGNFAQPTVSGDLLLTGRNAYPLEGCGVPTCEPIWSYSGHGSFAGAGPDTPVFYYTPGGLPPSTTGHFDAVSRTTGETEWTGSFDGSTAEFAIDDDYIYVTSNGSSPALQAYDVDGCGSSTCSPAWSASVSPDTGYADVPTVAGGVVYVAGWDRTIHAYSADGCGSSTCTEIVSIETGAGDGTLAMSVAHGRLFVSSSRGENGTHTVKAFAPASAA